jgi:mannose-6-phosphate isomerase-like protein (cupin superfamily)
MTEPVFSAEALEAFQALYPEQPGVLPHSLSGHPLFELEALAGLAKRLPAKNVEYNRGDLPVGIDPTATPSNGLGIVETIRRIEECGSWMVLKFVEQDPVYRDMLHNVLAEIEPLVRQVTGKMLKLEGFIFISSPDAVTPFHFDPEHNILLQLRGTKRMTVFPAADEAIVPGEAHETFHLGGHRNLHWQDEFAEKGEAFDLSPGRAIYVPVKAPHWVKNGPEPSVSFSITWRSEWSYREADARRMNSLLRRAGLMPSPPARYPQRNLVKSVAYQAARKAKLTG